MREGALCQTLLKPDGDACGTSGIHPVAWVVGRWWSRGRVWAGGRKHGGRPPLHDAPSRRGRSQPRTTSTRPVGARCRHVSPGHAAQAPGRARPTPRSTPGRVAVNDRRRVAQCAACAGPARPGIDPAARQPRRRRRSPPGSGRPPLRVSGSPSPSDRGRPLDCRVLLDGSAIRVFGSDLEKALSQ